jgi:two-component system response regulator YesN
MKKVLIVEDDDKVREILVAFIRHTRRFDLIDDVMSGEEALELFEPGKYDLIVLDISLVTMSGVEVSIKIRELDKNVIILGITGYSELVEQCDFSTAGFNNCFLKPFYYTDLFDFIDAM